MPTTTPPRKPAKKKPAPAAKRPARKASKPKRSQAAEVRIRYYTCPPLPPGLSEEQRTAAAILSAGLPLPKEFEQVLPVALEAQIRRVRPLAHELDETQPRTVIVEMQPAKPVLTPEQAASVRAAVAEQGGNISNEQAMGRILGRQDLFAIMSKGEHDLLEWAWAIISNAGVPQGDWASMSEEWQKVATAWRNRYHEILHKKQRGGMTIPALFTLAGQKISVGIVPDLMTPQNPAQANYNPDAGLIHLQRPNHFFAPSRTVLERAFCHALAAAIINEAGVKPLLTDARFVEAIGNGLHQFITSQTGDAEA